MTDPSTDYLTITEAVARLRERGVRVAHETVRRWAKSGRVPAKRLPGGQYRIAADDLETVIEPVSGVA